MEDQRQKSIRYRLVDPEQNNFCFYTVEAKWPFEIAKRSAEYQLQVYKKERPLAYSKFEFGAEEEEVAELTCITCKKRFIVEKMYDDPDKEGYCSLDCMESW